jgi:hypothetical protein
MTGKAIALLAGGLIAAAGVGSALGDLGGDDNDDPIDALEVRKDDSGSDVELIDEEDDRGDGGRDDDSRGNDGRGDGSRGKGADSGQGGQAPSQDPQTGSGGGTGGTGNTGGTGWPGDTDGDVTGGNDGTGGGDNSYVAVADDSYAAPAPAYEYGGEYSDDGGSDG